MPERSRRSAIVCPKCQSPNTIRTGAYTLGERVVIHVLDRGEHPPEIIPVARPQGPLPSAVGPIGVLLLLPEVAKH